MIFLKKLEVDGILFFTGAVGYCTLELLWRGRTHWSMMLAGGLCFLSFAKIEEHMQNAHRLYRCIVGSAAVTVTEFFFGVVFNVFLDKGVWDYSRIPFNFMGQICLLYSVIWGFLCLPCMPFALRIYKSLLGVGQKH